MSTTSSFADVAQLQAPRPEVPLPPGKLAEGDPGSAGTGADWLGLHTPLAAKIIREKARKLADHPRLWDLDGSDIAQELSLHVWRHFGKHDPSRGKRSTFIRTLVNRKVASMLRAHRGMRGARPSSLDDPVKRDAGRTVALAETLDAATVSTFAGLNYGDGVKPTIDAVAVNEARQSLPPHLRVVAELAVDERPACIARALGISRRRVTNSMCEIRRVFVQAGFGPDS